MANDEDPLIHSLTIFWQQIERALDVVAPRRIVEIGSEAGGMTLLLTEWAEAHGSEVVSVDPSPAPETIELASVSAALELVQLPSPWGLADVSDGDLYIVDGDHNYWTVSAELEHAFSGERPALAILHDVGWPSGRRDQYYAPDLLPAEAVHPYSYAQGVAVGNPGLVDGGFRGAGAFAFAATEGGERNGVLTAAEDFVTARGSLRLLTIPSVFGLGFLFPQSAPWATDLAATLADLEHLELLKTLESNRLNLYLRLIEVQDRELRANDALAHAHQTMVQAKRELDYLAAENQALREQIERG